MRKLAIIGGGESGVGCALLGIAKDYEVFVSDFGQIKPEYKAELSQNKIPFEEGGHDFERLEKYDVIMKSPGVPPKAALIKHLVSNGKQIISEIEFASRYTQAKIIGITGSNGKTTCSGLTYHLLKEAGLNVCLAGNIGQSFARSVVEDAYDYYVLELSSFQLDDIIQFKADVAVLLNITPDHLDRYDYDFSKYVKSKFRITENQGEEDVLIYNDLDPVLFEEWKHFAGKQKTILLSQDTYNADQLSTDNRYFFEIKNFSLKGRHNQLNALCAIHIAQTLGIANETIQASLLSYSNFPHRMENVGIWKGISFINDSKATNVDAVYYALDAMRKPVVWIAGGTDKGNEYEALFPVVEGKVKCLICLGLDSEKLKEAFKGRINTILETKEIEEAVQMAIESAEVGDVILLSPACASFDLFNNYEHRGNAFKKEVSKYIKRIK